MTGDMSLKNLLMTIGLDQKDIANQSEKNTTILLKAFAQIGRLGILAD